MYGRKECGYTVLLGINSLQDSQRKKVLDLSNLIDKTFIDRRAESIKLNYKDFIFLIKKLDEGIGITQKTTYSIRLLDYETEEVLVRRILNGSIVAATYMISFSETLIGYMPVGVFSNELAPVFKMFRGETDFI